MTARTDRGRAPRRARVRVGRLVVAGAATTVTAVSVVGGIDQALVGARSPGIVGEASATTTTTTTAAPRRPVSSSAPAVGGQPRTGVEDVARDARRAEPREAPQVPERASGRFDVAAGTTDRAGTGPLLTYTVETERGLPRARGVAGVVDGVLASPKGWGATGAASLRRVPAHPDIRIRLASPETADQLCSPLDTGGRLSCRNGDLVVLNAWRWVNGAHTYAGDLRAYRQYMVNHEVGHALGNAHASCTEPGQPASVMMQQTKGLGGCRPNPWPTIGH